MMPRTGAIIITGSPVVTQCAATLATTVSSNGSGAKASRSSVPSSKSR